MLPQCGQVSLYFKRFTDDLYQWSVDDDIFKIEELLQIDVTAVRTSQLSVSHFRPHLHPLHLARVRRAAQGFRTRGSGGFSRRA